MRGVEVMLPLDRSLRGKLEKTVKEAREIAEAAAFAVLEQMGVSNAAPYAHLSEAERELRRKLRIHGRQLGDLRDPAKETQETDRLVEEIAYQHWHRMLFARFLSENNLLMYPDQDNPVPVTLEECEDLAAEEGAKNGWELASRFAARMLPQIFRPDSPVFQLTLPPEHQNKLERLLADLPSEIFTASDSIGWVYQFWQSKKKDEINASEVKIGARELPAVTQLFTEPYMVSFLLDNSLGAWWAARHLIEADLENAENEEELKSKAALTGMPLKYLRFIRGEDGKWTPAAGNFEKWPEHLSKLKVLDPCCGSGHFLVAALLMLVPIRIELEGLSAREAVDAVLQDNLHGLEIDQRCVEIAAFALALSAWRYHGTGGYRRLPELNLACSGLSVGVSKEEWQKLSNGNQNLRIALGLLFEEFGNASVLGSLINPRKSDATKLVNWDELATAISAAIKKERPDEEHEAGVVAYGLSKAATLLSGKYNLVITNVPYLARGKQNETLRDFSKSYFDEAKNDLATVFLDRCLEFCVNGGTTSIVLPQNWLFLTTYSRLREKLLRNHTWHLIARMGEGGFESSAAAGAFTILLTLSRSLYSDHPQESDKLFTHNQSKSHSHPHQLSGLDVSNPRTAAEKAVLLPTTEVKRVDQAKQLDNPDARVALDYIAQQRALLEAVAESGGGISTFDSPRFLFQFWEQPTKVMSIFMFCQSSPDGDRIFSGRSQILKWQDGKGELFQLMEDKRIFEGYSSGIWQVWSRFVGMKGICVGMMRGLPVTFYDGYAFDNNTGVIIPKTQKDISATWCFCSSNEYHDEIRKIDQKLNVTSGTLVKVPFDLEHWTQIAQEKYPNGLPKPYSNDPTQWIFHGHPCGSVVWDEDKKWTAHGPLRTDDTVLQVAVARLLGYRWPAELDPAMELADEQREWVKHSEALLQLADEDGIVCIPPVRGEPSAADRLLNLLAAAYGTEWSTNKLAQLLKHADHAGKTLETWLRYKFFSQHCKIFHHRPFIWHIWDGLQDGFAVLVNYQKLNRRNLEALIYTYLGDWITLQKDNIKNGVDGAEEKLAAAEALKKRLELILEGEAPYDIFVRWKPIERQPIGWNPDLNDGVRLNIRPFLSVPDVVKRGAGVLRDKPNINWNKDRGKDVASAPWYHLFKGERINDHHLSLTEKNKAREASK